jgi:uncharacterized membrane protein
MQDTPHSSDDTTTQVQSTPRSSSLIVALVVIGVLITGSVIGWSMYHRSSTPAEQLPPLSADDATNVLMTDWLNLQHLSVDGTITVDFGPDFSKDDDVQEAIAVSGIQGTEIRQLNTTLKTAYNIEGSDDTDSLYFQAGGSVSTESDTQSVSLELSAVNKLLYGRLNIPASLEQSLETALKKDQGLDADLGFLFNHWVTIDVNKLLKQFPISDEYMKQLEDFNAQRKLTSEEMQALTDGFQQHPFIRAGEVVGNEELHGVQTTKYRLTFDEKQFTDFVVTVAPAMDRLLATAKQPMPSSAELRSELEAFFESSDWQVDLNKALTIEGYVWISPVDRHVHRISVYMAPTQTEDQAELKSVTGTVDFSQHNQVITIDPPSDTTSFESMVGEAVVRFGGAAYKQNQEQIDAPTTELPTTTPAN